MLPQGQQPAGDGGDKQEGHAEVLYHEAATLLVCKMAFECRQKQRQPAEEEGDGADGALDQKAEGEPKSRTPEHVLAIRQIPFGKCPHGEGDEKGEAGIDPDPVAVHDEALHGTQSDHRPEGGSAGAQYPPGQQAGEQQGCHGPQSPHQTQRHRDAEVVVEQGKKGNGEDVIEGRFFDEATAAQRRDSQFTAGEHLPGDGRLARLVRGPQLVPKLTHQGDGQHHQQ